MRASALFCAKNFGFFEICGVSAWTIFRASSVEPVRTFFGEGGKGVFYGRPISLLYTKLRDFDNIKTFS